MAHGHVRRGVRLGLLVGLLAACSADNDDLFSSTFEMRRLFLTEIQFARDLLDYVSAVEQHAADMRKAVSQLYPDGPPHAEDSDSDSDSEATSKAAEAYVANPLNALGIISRLGHGAHATGVLPIMSNMSRIDELRQRLNNASAIFPSAANYRDATSSVSLLQEAYGLNHSELAAGVVRFGGKSFSSSYVPSWTDLSKMGNTACNRGWWDSGLTFYRLAIEKCPRDPGNDKELARIKEELETGKKFHDHLLDKKGMFGLTHRCLPLPFDEKMRKKKKFKAARQGKVERQISPRIVPLFTATPSHTSLADNFHLLCKGDAADLRAANLTRPPALDARLKCEWLHRGNPYLRLAPFKAEELNEAPVVILFHDFFYDSECAHMMKAVDSRLERSGVGELSKSKKDLTRTSKQAWITDRIFKVPENTTTSDKAPDDNADVVEGSSGSQFKHQFEEEGPIHAVPYRPERFLHVVDEVAFRLSLRIQNATGLSVNGPFSSEQYQVANYGLGGQYSTHLDPHGFYDGVMTHANQEDYNYYATQGDRVATFMGYLTSVELGGATVFPLLGLASRATKGSAIFWVNLIRDGTRDYLTHHGGCPVLVGSKWITNKWIQYHDQF